MVTALKREPEVMASKKWRGIKLYTIGHSTRTLDELVAMLRAFDISVLADIRTISPLPPQPSVQRRCASRRLSARRRLRYVHLPELGGLRRARKDSPNTAWRNASFRGFADYMMTEDFEAGLAELHALTAERQSRSDVRGGRAVALPSLPRRRRPDRPRSPCRAHHRLQARDAAPHDAVRRRRRYSVSPIPARTPQRVPLATRAPFHLEATVRVLQRRPTNLVDVWEPDRYLRVLQTADDLALVEVENRGTIDAPDLRFVVRRGNPSTATRAALGQTLRKVLGLDLDPEPLQRLWPNPNAGCAPRRWRCAGMRPPRFAELFEAFANVVPFQQLSLDAGVAIVGRLVERFGKRSSTTDVASTPFQRPRSSPRLDLGALRECGLSLRKAESLRPVASAIESGELTEEKLSRHEHEEALRFLAELQGIGPWSASLVLLRGLGRLDVFPPGDVGVARGLGSLMRLETDLARSGRRALRRPAGLPLLLFPGRQPAGQGSHPRGSFAVLNRAPGGPAGPAEA